MEGFEKAMEVQREKARESWKGSGEKAVSESYQKLSVQGIRTQFVGYEGVTEDRSNILAILKNDQPVETFGEGEKAEIIVERPPSTARRADRSAIRGSLKEMDSSLKYGTPNVLSRISLPISGS